MMLGGPQARSGQVRKISPPPGFFLIKEALLIQLIHGRLYLLLLLISDPDSFSVHQFIVPAGALYGFGASVFLPPGKGGRGCHGRCECPNAYNTVR
jgi:hypothetical protein